MDKIAILGGGPAGSFAAESLARAGHRTILLDEKMAWEKPCGGGLTYKAYEQYPFLLNNDTPKRFVHETSIAAPQGGEATLKLEHPLIIYSRFDLNQMLLHRAEKAGTQLEKTRVIGMERKGRGWRLKTPQGTIEADYCVVAMGARNPFREVGTEWTSGDTMSAMGYYVPGAQKQIDIQFLPKLEGYIWIFPRCGHLSVGICGKGLPASALRLSLEQYMDRRGISRTGARFYSHMLPSLETAGWKNNRVAGDGWVAVGDSAGLVDPITGEGLYYAMRSGDLAGQSISKSPGNPSAEYGSSIAHEFGHDLAFASVLARRFFAADLLFRSVPQRMVEFIRVSSRFRILMQDLFAGTQPYLDLRSRLIRSLEGPLPRAVAAFLLESMFPSKAHLASSR